MTILTEEARRALVNQIAATLFEDVKFDAGWLARRTRKKAEEQLASVLERCFQAIETALEQQHVADDMFLGHQDGGVYLTTIQATVQNILTDKSGDFVAFIQDNIPQGYQDIVRSGIFDGDLELMNNTISTTFLQKTVEKADVKRAEFNLESVNFFVAVDGQREAVPSPVFAERLYNFLKGSMQPYQYATQEQFKESAVGLLTLADERGDTFLHKLVQQVNLEEPASAIKMISVLEAATALTYSPVLDIQNAAGHSPARMLLEKVKRSYKAELQKPIEQRNPDIIELNHMILGQLALNSDVRIDYPDYHEEVTPDPATSWIWGDEILSQDPFLQAVTRYADMAAVAAALDEAKNAATYGLPRKFKAGEHNLHGLLEDEYARVSREKETPVSLTPDLVHTAWHFHGACPKAHITRVDNGKSAFSGEVKSVVNGLTDLHFTTEASGSGTFIFDVRGSKNVDLGPFVYGTAFQEAVFAEIVKKVVPIDPSLGMTQDDFLEMHCATLVPIQAELRTYTDARQRHSRHYSSSSSIGVPVSPVSAADDSGRDTLPPSPAEGDTPSRQVDGSGAERANDGKGKGSLGNPNSNSVA